MATTSRKTAAKTAATSAAATSAAKTGKRAAAEGPARATAPRTAAPRGAASRGTAPATAARAAPGIAGETLDTLAHLQQIKTDLEAVSAKLNGFDPDAMSPAEREAWSNDMDRIDLAIARARNALLSGLVQAFDAEAADLQAATGQLAADLQRLTKIAQVIETVAAVLGVVERVITLGR